MQRRVLFDALAARYGGGAYAAMQLSRHLAVHPRVSELLVVTRAESIVERGLEGTDGVRCVALPAARHLELARRLAWESTALRALARGQGCDAVVTMAGLPARFRDARVICLLGNPVMYESGGIANRLRRAATRRTGREASYLAAPSQMMADLVSASVGRPCAVLPWGVDHDLFAPAAQPGTEILCVADFYAHKRHDLLLDAWLRLPEPRPVLRLIGNPAVDPSTYARVRARVEALGVGGAVKLAGHVSLGELVRAYHRARVFVMPSEHESFCMPLAEAMACGAPGVARDIRSLRDTGAAGAIYVNGDDAGDWAAAIARMTGDDAEHARAREAALAAASQFSWESCAAAVAEHV
jgi:glycosyltransferase involved in cell wall biosynthesis